MGDEPAAESIYDEVRDYYSRAVREGRDGYGDTGVWGASRYDTDVLEGTPSAAAELSMGCGNPFAMADLVPGETVLDLGSGGGLDVILSARRVAPTGKAYGVDFLDEMIEVATAHAAQAGVDNVEFLKGLIEDVPLPDASVDVVISNCVICLAPDKAPVFREIFRVLRPGGRVAVSDVVAAAGYEPPGAEGEWAECGAGALSHGEFIGLLADAGLVDVTIEDTHETGPRLTAAIIRARKP